MTEPPDAAVIAANLAAVRARVARAAEANGRTADAVQLVAVSKTFGLDAIRAAIAAGQQDFGENRVQEALPKIEALSAEHPDLRWHLIGHLQSNKARKAGRPFDAVHSVDSLELLRRLDEAAADGRRQPLLLVQVDLAGEATKFGATPDEARAIVQAAASLRAARLVGLMTLPPFYDDPVAARPIFARLRAFRDELVASGVPAAQLAELSMGMSHDFEVAIAEGATIVRVGSAIFGARAKL
ncbi:MAG: YggS family pyridoxal phosphate-dependent enzyme [Vicinamibacteraceae bacterium]